MSTCGSSYVWIVRCSRCDDPFDADDPRAEWGPTPRCGGMLPCYAHCPGCASADLKKATLWLNC
jgi:hypothetical protein